MRRSLSLVIAGLLIAGCSNVGPGATLPPFNIPSFNIPSFTIPSIPPFELPSGLPTIPPGVLPSADAGSGLCTLASPAEVGAIMGGAVTVTESTTASCSYITASFSTINLRTEQGDLATSRILLTNAKDVTVGAYPGVIGSFLGGPILYIQRGGDLLVVHGILVADDEANQAKLVQIGQTAAARW